MDKKARHERIEQLFHAALAQDPSERADFLKRACASDPVLLAEVQSLLSEHERTGTFMASPAYEINSELLAAPEGSLAGKSFLAYESRGDGGRLHRNPGAGGRGQGAHRGKSGVTGGAAARLVQDPLIYRRRWNGRGLPGARHEARARGRAESPARSLRARCGAAGTLPPRGASAGFAQPSEHRGDLWAGRV